MIRGVSYKPTIGKKNINNTQTIHVWYIYLHLPYYTIKDNQM